MLRDPLASARRRLVFALDVDSPEEARDLVSLLEGEVGTFKVGKQLFVRAGPEIVRWIVARGGDVFLDLKFHDIPRTVANAGIEAARLGVSIFNVHASGSTEMMQLTARDVRAVCRREGLRRPAILAVTVLTSLVREDLRRVGVIGTMESQVVRLARLARDSGMDGVVASPQEVASIRAACGARFIILTPGVRPSESSLGDQKRVMTPGGAIRAGSDLLVVGRPIRDAADPRTAAREIVEEIAAALRDRRGARGPARPAAVRRGSSR